MSKKRKHKQRVKNRNMLEAENRIKTYKTRYIELCHQFEQSTNIHTKNTIKAQLTNICTLINDLLNNNDKHETIHL